MLKRKLSIALSALAITTSVMFPVKKAEAGVILLLTGGGPIFSALAVGGGLLSIYGWTAYGDSTNNLVGGIDNLGLTSEGYKAIALIGTALLVLDKESQSQPAFETIPSYLIEEIQNQVSYKAEFTEANEQGLKEIVFSDVEVDELFKLADETTSQLELENLRTILTTPIL